MSEWEPTRHGGFRRIQPRVAQVESAAQIKQRPVGRNHPRGQFSLEWGRRLGLPECKYVIRWMIGTPLGSVRLHHWLGPDDDRAPHDHPWWFITLVLRGGYTDHGPDGDDQLGPGSVRLRRALHRHTVFPGPHGAWTLVLTGPKRRSWGFWEHGKLIRANKWFAGHGHHPCT